MKELRFLFSSNFREVTSQETFVLEYGRGNYRYMAFNDLKLILDFILHTHIFDSLKQAEVYNVPTCLVAGSSSAFCSLRLFVRFPLFVLCLQKSNYSREVLFVSLLNMRSSFPSVLDSPWYFLVPVFRKQNTWMNIYQQFPIFKML